MFRTKAISGRTRFMVSSTTPPRNAITRLPLLRRGLALSSGLINTPEARLKVLFSQDCMNAGVRARVQLCTMSWAPQESRVGRDERGLDATNAGWTRRTRVGRDERGLDATNAGWTRRTRVGRDERGLDATN